MNLFEGRVIRIEAENSWDVELSHRGRRIDELLEQQFTVTVSVDAKTAQRLVGSTRVTIRPIFELDDRASLNRR